jgi:four helix bundle protein
MSKEYKGYRDLIVYQKSYTAALGIYELSKTFPAEEKYSLTDQIRRSSRSVPANIAEGWRKRKYPKMFVSKLIDCSGEASETEVWLDFSKDLKYLTDVAQKIKFQRTNVQTTNKYQYSMSKINSFQHFGI